MSIIIDDLGIISSFISKIQLIYEILPVNWAAYEFNCSDKLKSFKDLHYYS